MTNEKVKGALHDLKALLKQLESKELYENCTIIKQEIDLIETNNEVGYLKFKFDIKELQRCGFLAATNDNSVHIKKICTFFEYESIFEYSRLVKGLHVSSS